MLMAGHAQFKRVELKAPILQTDVWKHQVLCRPLGENCHKWSYLIMDTSVKVTCVPDRCAPGTIMVQLMSDCL